jgi:ABC-type glutathione transport system ATPase component
MLKVFLDKVSVIKENNERAILRNINFGLEENKIHTILGKNGSGKTTLLKSLTKLLDERFYSVDGKVFLNGKNIFEMDEKELLKVRRKEIKYIFQDPVNTFDHLKTFGYYFKTTLSLIEKTIKNNNEFEELLDFFLLPDAGTLFKMYPYEVSGGMAQRISFILAFLSRPKIIFLDEPTSGIDAPVTNLVLLKLKEFVKEKDKAVLLVTQDLEFAKSASDKISFLSEGTLSNFKDTTEFFKESVYE